MQKETGACEPYEPSRNDNTVHAHEKGTRACNMIAMKTIRSGFCLKFDPASPAKHAQGQASPQTASHGDEGHGDEGHEN